MNDFAARIDGLRARLADTSDVRENNALIEELGRVNREKVLRRQGPPAGDTWVPVPYATLRIPLSAVPADGIKDLVKSFFRVVSAGLYSDDAAASAPDQFVSLLRLAVEDDALRLMFVCPYEAALHHLKGVGAPPALDGFDIHHQYTLAEDLLLPVVFSLDRKARRLLLTNHNHFADPDQFLSPWRCRTTSGLLNFIGATTVAVEARGMKGILVSQLEQLMNEGLDEWFRWFYCFMENGLLFGPERLTVKRENPEEYAYEYSGGDS
ncbi:hypothetical protein [Nonomuraea basaltis]|uniref:hypothetical protein n=1 Tax=Nonomuraea basaltis TaxID=2495887 RepID=UPI00110C64D1|nr:hypothetical protein [Nonomuraea basaltis]TMR94275.1 hypothetical protein EJK15_34865 [Nonomuraea basaltis]